ncbi:L-threonylcarbamoyladenylate synthase [Flavobacteriaceae bacterium]|jgi:tRNA threonylcarbamoyl adenosine modification protein (Sua5/YciO/YrdC/YwlC family)|nr:L-threonylcarbamoyladenylate synthase [bacterium]MDA9341986.1 L-threonylcarbamoyladenylate synthase [Flavobacteriaceae bacterium]MDB9913065.1 L-threonylcarbamoyladenylate synthase [Flavobacteriaceae bacterium]MDB9993368.1 L-threonylcarbamoyladenylate synthase [Flavobacteriaceae bacterium]|tara:strand:- start:453 stop:1070 length:618 start_codon:yes stop_codon:yes gene_type:complete
MAAFIKLYEENPNPEEIKKVVSILKKGGLIIYPSDSVYALGCDISNYKALEKVARIKGVKLDKANFSFVCESISNISSYVTHISTPTFKILKRALPGPYTFILPGNNNLPKAFKKKKEVGIRVPNNEIVLAIVRELGNPIISTSIYDEDEIVEYTTDPELIYEKWGSQVDIVIDGGYGGNIPTTVINLCGDKPELIREGKGSLDI